METHLTLHLAAKESETSSPTLNRRRMMAQVLAGLGGLALTASSQANIVVDPIELAPHLASTDPNDLNSLPWNGVYLASALEICNDIAVGSLQAFLLVHQANLQTSSVAVALREASRAERMPTSLAAFSALVVRALLSPDKEETCWQVPAPLQAQGLESCVLLRPAQWYETTLVTLILGLMQSLPGPEAVPEALARVGKLLEERLPAGG